MKNCFFIVDKYAPQTQSKRKAGFENSEANSKQMHLQLQAQTTSLKPFSFSKRPEGIIITKTKILSLAKLHASYIPAGPCFGLPSKVYLLIILKKIWALRSKWNLKQVSFILIWVRTHLSLRFSKNRARDAFRAWGTAVTEIGHWLYIADEDKKKKKNLIFRPCNRLSMNVQHNLEIFLSEHLHGGNIY